MVETAALANGLKLPYVEQGDPSGVPVVFLHAFADSWRSFERVLPCLPRSIRAFAVTQRGHGDADRPASGYGVEQFTADVSAFMDTVGLEAAVIVAIASAGLTAQRFGVEHPRRTLGWCLSVRHAASATSPGPRGSSMRRAGLVLLAYKPTRPELSTRSGSRPKPPRAHRETAPAPPHGPRTAVAARLAADPPR
ncbi:MAG: alpha/beta fold hydrolase [Solirubrobacteraceae bacterium]